MSEKSNFDAFTSSQNEVDENDVFMPASPCVGSPCSTDSGHSSSPDSPISSVHENSSDNSLMPEISSEISPQAAESTAKKLLDLVIAANTQGERSLLFNLLATALNKTKPANISSNVTNVLQVTPSPGQKRPASEPVESAGVVCKKQKTTPTLSVVNPSIVMIEEPEKHYRARYPSEGCRGPVRGSTDLTFPTFQVKGYNGPLWVTIYLATRDGTPHFHLLRGPGSNKLPCRDITLQEGINAIQVYVTPETGMTAILDCISVTRQTKADADRSLKKRGFNPAEWTSERKEACLVISADIPGQPSKTVSCKSRVFQLTGPQGNPEINWLGPVQGSVNGGEEIGIIGKKFRKGFQVRFYGELPSGEMWQAFGEINRKKSNQNACVVKCPALPATITSPLIVNVEVRGVSDDGDVRSESVSFTYLPEQPAPIDPELDDFIELILGTARNGQEIDQIHGVDQVTPSVRQIHGVDQEWDEVSNSLDELYRSGRITEHQHQKLKLVVSQRDILLLENYRSSKLSDSDSDFVHVCQYIASWHGRNIVQH